MDYFQINIFIIVLCVMLSALFSGSESALFSLKKSDLHRFSHSKVRRSEAIYNLMKNPQKILITLLTGNLFVNLVISMLSTELCCSVLAGMGGRDIHCHHNAADNHFLRDFPQDHGAEFL